MGSSFRRPAVPARPAGSATSGALNPTVAAQAGRVQTKLSVQRQLDPWPCIRSMPHCRARLAPDGHALRKATPERDPGKVNPRTGVGLLHSCFAVVLVVDNQN